MDRDFFTTRGDSRIAVTLPRNKHTMRLGRENRFLIDDFVSGKGMLAFTLSKPLKIGHSYEEENGVYKFVLHEVNSTEFDNFELGIADYYKVFPRDGEADPENPEEPASPEEAEDTAERIDENTGKKRWL